MGKITMAERIVKIETELKNVSKNLGTHIEEQKSDFKEIKVWMEKFDGRIDNALDKKANKWCEKAFLTLLITMIAGSAVAILTFLLNNTN